MKRIWFNHWFSQAYHFINNLKQDEDNYVISSNERSNCIYQYVSDEFYLEPVFENDVDYVNWCLDFCKKHNIDVFFPRRRMDAITERAADFVQMGIKLILDTNLEVHNLLQSKVASCEYMKEHNLCNVPLMIPVSNFDDFLIAYKAIKLKYGDNTRICMKRSIDEGAQSFKRIYDDNVAPMYGKDIYYTDVVDVFSDINPKTSNPYIVMPYMEEPEISIDCLRTDSGFIAIPRYKESTRFTRIDFDEELISYANKINEDLKIQYPYNIQFRKFNDTWMFMEINTRMAGGSFKATAVGCDFASLALKIAYNEPIDTENIKKNFKNKYIGNVEGFIVIE